MIFDDPTPEQLDPVVDALVSQSFRLLDLGVAIETRCVICELIKRTAIYDRDLRGRICGPVCLDAMNSAIKALTLAHLSVPSQTLIALNP